MPTNDIDHDLPPTTTAIYVKTFTQSLTHAHTRMHTHAHACTHTHTHAHTHTHTHTETHTETQTQAHTTNTCFMGKQSLETRWPSAYVCLVYQIKYTYG